MSGTVELRGVTQAYGARQVLQDISFKLESGVIACLLGASGCGKTTVLRCIAGFERVAEGEILLDAAIVSRPGYRLPPESRRIGMVFQDYALFPWMTVRENIGFGPRQKGMAKKYADEITDEYLNMVGLAKFANRFPQQLSGGMKQRVAIARVLANEIGRAHV